MTVKLKDVLKYVKNQAEPVFVTTVAKGMNISIPTARLKLKTLVDRGDLCTVQVGAYLLYGPCDGGIN